MRVNFWYISSFFISVFVLIPILTVFSSFFENTSNYYQVLKDTFLVEYILNSLIWKMLLLFGIRFNYFSNITDRKILMLKTEPNLYLDNLSLYASKTMSMMVVLVGQLYFRFRHKGAFFLSPLIHDERVWVFQIHNLECMFSNIGSLKIQF